jgi:hypothetical protein
MENDGEQTNFDIKLTSKAILDTLEKEREREIISRRFGLYDRKETLEQVGELLGITRERVRQLEKAILSNLKASAVKIASVIEAEKVFVAKLEKRGGSAKVKDMIKDFIEAPGRDDHNHVTFIGTIAPGITVVDENDDFHQGVAIGEKHPAEKIKGKVTEIVKTIKTHGEPMKVEEIHEKLPEHDQALTVEALARLSKHVANLKEDWGLIKWPLVNPKNIRDKIYIILRDHGSPMHFNEIAKSIRDSDFKRKDVTQQAIHNELIKDKRFVLIGRGIYALNEWGYKQGIVSDVIEEVLKEANEPLHRDEIVKRVLAKRQVKETTILLNLQGKPQFVRTSKATYSLDESKKK